MKRKYLIIAIIAILLYILLSSCGDHTTTKVITKTVKVHVYVTHPKHKSVDQTNLSVDNNDVVFWYIMMSNDNSYYYYQSPTQITNFSNTKFEVSNNFPIITAEGEEKPVEETPIEIPESEIDGTVVGNINPAEETETETETTTETSETSSETSNDAGSDAGSDGGGGGGGD